ncbi:RNA 2',3'-cyclic phosphodiesterase [Promicromonospora thailandica]|uniref:RNA 2',3'-cyclic phosphodiesterase n=1 Tax=Promicromonospora thailandica TaxID=765201 RepID=A0A9X2JU16_9MICO|nr:RNA 2',3'-cyclic phosphodiesterase [Promicromonospora thailandica]MCP2264045.1 2'-5' RNA ligase [Promicromonospora thailandica]BFF17617.1 RNA 2',3'-cyclic phosphodiesterase [Promicromonospora thailandica]
MRLFTAVVPPPSVLDHLELAIDGVPASPRWVPRENLHITLAFYADLPEGTVPELCEELAAVARKHGPVDLRLRGAGSFGARVLWIGVDGRTDALRDLAADCLAASPREVPDDVKPHRAHVTVARARAGQVKPPRGRDRWGKRGGGEPRSALEPAAQALSVYAGPAWTADTLALVESRPGEGPQGGPLYDVVETWSLDG